MHIHIIYTLFSIHSGISQTDGGFLKPKTAMFFLQSQTDGGKL